MRAIPLAVLPTVIVLAASVGLLGRWLSTPGRDVELAPPAASRSLGEEPEAVSPDETRVVAPDLSPPRVELELPESSDVPPTTEPAPSSQANGWTEARWASFVRDLRARFSNAVNHIEDYRGSMSIHHEMLATQRRLHDSMQSSDLHGHLKLARIATESRERELNAAIETLEAPARLFDQLVAIRQTSPAESDRFVPLLEELAGKCEAAGNAFELANAHWATARDHENRTFVRISKIHQLKTQSDALAANARHRTARSLGEDAKFEAKWAAKIAASNRDLIRTYRSFNVLQVEGELQKIDNLAVQNQKFAEELDAISRTLFQTSRMSDTELSRHTKKLQDISTKVDANEAEINRALAAVKVRVPQLKVRL